MDVGCISNVGVHYTSRALFITFKGDFLKVRGALHLWNVHPVAPWFIRLFSGLNQKEEKRGEYINVYKIYKQGGLKISELIKGKSPPHENKETGNE